MLPAAMETVSRVVRLLAISGFLGVCTFPAHSDLIFEFDYSGAPEFTDPDLGEARRHSLEDAAISLSRYFDHDAEIQITVSSEFDPDSGTLASAAGAVRSVDFDFVGYAGNVVEHKILTGIDANGPAADGEVSVNFGEPWDLDDDVAADHFDFKATIIHELVHALGFVSGVFADGTDLYETPPGIPGVWFPFDRHLSDASGDRIIDENYALDPNLWEALSTGGTSPENGLFFAGPHTVAANDGEPVGLYSPAIWEDGSSGSHLDDDNPDLAGLAMLAASDTGPYTRDLSPLEIAMLRDIGYSINAPTTAPVTIDVGISQPGHIEIILMGEPGSYLIQESSDLVEWSDVATLIIEAGESSTGAELRIQTPSSFFRTESN